MSTRSDDPRRPAGSAPSQGEWVRYEPGGTSPTGSDDDLFMRSPRRPPQRGRRHTRLFGYLLVAVLALLLGLAVGYVRGYFSAGDVGQEVTVVVSPGDTLSAIATKLESAGVVEHAGAFVVRVQADGYASQLKPGTYALRENEPYDDLVAALIAGQRPVTVKVTIPEGSTLEQSGSIVAKEIDELSSGEYVRIARDDPPKVRLKGYETGSSLEGLLFPATYEVAPDISARKFIDKQVDAFEAALAQVDMARARKANLTPYDVVIIASMIEREAQVPEERATVAAVIWNRLSDGMLLQIDATIQYALGKTKPVLTFDDLKIDSPFNTYTNEGLPPTPIANPGLASLQAAANPAEVDYLYYVARADGTGRHYFSRSYEEFLANQAKAARNSQ